MIRRREGSTERKEGQRARKPIVTLTPLALSKFGRAIRVGADVQLLQLRPCRSAGARHVQVVEQRRAVEYDERWRA
jgi:hypothetical protein